MKAGVARCAAVERGAVTGAVVGAGALPLERGEALPAGGYSMTRKTVPFLGGASRKAWSVASALPPLSAGIVRVSHSSVTTALPGLRW